MIYTEISLGIIVLALFIYDVYRLNTYDRVKATVISVGSKPDINGPLINIEYEYVYNEQIYTKKIIVYHYLLMPKKGYEKEIMLNKKNPNKIFTKAQIIEHIFIMIVLVLILLISM